MANDQEKPESGIPDWQRGQEESGKPAEDQLDVARRFLDDDEVKSAPREKKVAFLKAKGVEDGDIEKLLSETEQQPKSEQTDEAVSAESSTTSSEPSPTPSPESSPESSLPSPSSDRAPIVTYPEFLANPTPTSSPPLVTTARLLTALQLSAGLSALLIGTSKLVLSPMLEHLTASREELHSTTASRLNDMVSLLEKSVSVVPPPPGRKKHGALSDDDSDAGDPTEMFHRDVGTQTFLPVPSAASAPKLPPAETQATRLDSLTRSLSDIKDGLRAQSEGLSDVKTLIDVFGDDLDALTYRSAAELPGYDMLRTGTKGEPDDEIRKVRDSIRRIKGTLLSTRSFPTSMSR
ncbi:hypothetical protein ACO1O0_002482 [Amphichorda felina]